MGINDLNDTFAPLRNYTNFKANNDNLTTETQNQDKKDTKKKVLVTAAAIGTATLAAVYGVRKYNVTNIKNIQKAFQETFMRNDITIEQARAMKQRYQEIEKIKDREEYAKALFEEAKKNYGLEDSPIKLIFEPLEGVSNANGFCSADNSAISICPKCPREHILDAMHHEFRHAKQHEYLGTPEELQKYADECISKAQDIKDPDEFASKLISEYFESKENSVPEHLKEWFDKIKQGSSNHALNDFSDYYNRFVEIDARKAGRTISKFVRGKAFTPKDWMDDFLCLKPSGNNT